jgi:hypothetical protein
MLAANRRNSLKSTGPRTRPGKRRASLNSLKYGAYARPDTQWREAMEKLGEDPGAYERLRQELMAAWHPSNSIEGMLVGDLADLYWIKRRTRLTRAELQFRAILVAGHEQELLPVTQRWSLTLSQDAALDRQIEAKIKLLLRLKSFRGTGAKRSKSRARWATRRTVLRFPTGRPPLSRRPGSRPSHPDKRPTAEVNEGKKHEISIKETKPLLGAESVT